jgi:hypothetical protein
MLAAKKIMDGELWCFTGVFAKNGVLNMVFWW